MILLVVFAIPVKAADVQTVIFDTSNHYLGTCSYTDSTTWTLTEDLQVDLFQVWYKWNSGETELAFTVKKDGQDFLSGEVIRSQCDSYQTAWCNGDLKIDNVFPKGLYEAVVANPRQCSIPSGNGTVRLYKVETDSPSITVKTDQSTKSATKSAEVKETTATTTTQEYPESCEGFPNWIYFIYVSLGLSVILNIILSILILRKK